MKVQNLMFYLNFVYFTTKKGEKVTKEICGWLLRYSKFF